MLRSLLGALREARATLDAVAAGGERRTAQRAPWLVREGCFAYQSDQLGVCHHRVKGSQVEAFAVHPGVVSTPLWRNTGGCISGLVHLFSNSVCFGVKNPEQVPPPLLPRPTRKCTRPPQTQPPLLATRAAHGLLLQHAVFRLTTSQDSSCCLRLSILILSRFWFLTIPHLADIKIDANVLYAEIMSCTAS